MVFESWSRSATNPHLEIGLNVSYPSLNYNRCLAFHNQYHASLSQLTFKDLSASQKATSDVDAPSKCSHSGGNTSLNTNCDEISCCKSYLGNNNEVRMTSNLPECWFRFFIMSSFLVVYMCIGAAIFCAIERDYEKASAEKLKAMWADFQKKNDVPTSLMEKFLSQHYNACDMGDHDQNDSNVQWDYISSLFFTGTILTTIGYGHSSPSTSGGRVFTIFYAVAGIPFMLGLLNVVAEILLTTLKAIKSRIKKKPCADVFHHEVFLSALMWVIILLIVMTLIFKAQESTWTYEQSIYFSFITMTTIGFGDFVPAQVNVENNSTGLVMREFFNMVLIFISVLIWYFLSQVSAQVLKVRLKKLYGRWTVDDRLVIGDNIEPVMPEEPDRPPADHCTCPCSCGYNDRMEYSEASYSVYSNYDNHSTGLEKGACPSVSDMSETSKRESIDHITLNNLESIRDDTDPEMEPSDSNSDLQNVMLVNVPKIPSIVITPVDQFAQSHTTVPPHRFLATEHPYDSGKGSSEMTFDTPETLQNMQSAESTSSLCSMSSGISSVCKSSLNNSSDNNARMRRSQSAEVKRSLINLSIGFPPTIRNSRSMCELDSVSGRRSRTPTQFRNHSNKNLSQSARNLESFSIHTQLFDDMMKS